SPRSRRAEWNRARLEVALGPPYRCLGEWLGNRNYLKGGDFDIAAMVPGLRKLAGLLCSGPVVLLCVCPDPERCHRSAITRAAQLCWPELVVRHLAPGERIGCDDAAL